MGVFQNGVRDQAATDGLYQYLRLSGRPGKML